MDVFDLLNYRQSINEKKIILSFEGRMSQEILRNLVETLKEKLLHDKDDLSEGDKSQYVVKRVFSIFIELAQNIQLHSAEQDFSDTKSKGSGIIVIRELESYFTLSSGNLCAQEDANKLKEYCEYINQLDAAELKKLYKRRLKEPKKENVRMGGMGLLDIARKSSNQIEFEMRPIEDEQVFSVLTIRIDKEV